jgi:hypothetical protein
MTSLSEYFSRAYGITSFVPVIEFQPVGRPVSTDFLFSDVQIGLWDPPNLICSSGTRGLSQDKGGRSWS